ncbi:UNVERIFIED_CONTAM: hypothetical protein K2H54_058736 [Gekko kuhli]
MGEVLARPKLMVPPSHGRRDPNRRRRLTMPWPTVSPLAQRAAGLMGQGAGDNPSRAHLPKPHACPATADPMAPWYTGEAGGASPPTTSTRGEKEPLHLPSAGPIAVQQHQVAEQGALQPSEDQGTDHVQVLGPSHPEVTAAEGQEQLRRPCQREEETASFL